jgi:predicted kinase
LKALPFFLALRAAIRAKVIRLEPARSSSQMERSRQYFEAAAEFLAPCPLDLVAVGGLSGAGKTSLARALAPYVGRAPGAVHLRTDVERKRLFGRGELDRLPADAYTPDVTEKTYETVRRKCALVLAAGHSVIADAAHLKVAERDAVRTLANLAEARFAGLWLDAPVSALLDRVSQREGDASDATTIVVEAQTAEDVGPIDWRRLDASGSAESLLEGALAEIGAQENSSSADG